MKRTVCLLLALLLGLSLIPAVRADVIFEPEDSFYCDHRDECQHHERGYVAAGPDDAAVVYRSPESSTVVERVKNGDALWISYVYEDPDGISWGFCEHYGEDHWEGWVPMDYLLLKYDYISFREEFGDRIIEESGTIGQSGGERVHFWNYPGSDVLDAAIVLEGEYLPEYEQTFTDDAGRKWGYIGYYMGVRNVWVCLDAPTADYEALYAGHAPQQVTHPVREDGAQLPEIKPGGPSLSGILAVVCVVAILSGGFLWITRKKKKL